MIQSLPVELWINVFRALNDSIGDTCFGIEAETSMFQRALYVKHLLILAALHRGWTAIAQFELFRHIILVNEKKAILLLKLLHAKEIFRNYALNVTSIRFGEMYACGCRCHREGLTGAHHEILKLCPNIIEVSCSSVLIQLEALRESYSL
jgi:hypothetical protein